MFLEPYTETSNTILSHLHCFLSRSSQSYLKLVLTLDNHSTNKSSTILAYASWLIQQQFVVEVLLIFLIVGHTHNRVDQKHSPVAHAISKMDANSLPQLVSTLPTYMGKEVASKLFFEILEHIWDWEQFFLPFLNPQFPSVIQQSHFFRITKDGVETKQWHEDVHASSPVPILGPVPSASIPSLCARPSLSSSRWEEIQTTLGQLGKTGHQQDLQELKSWFAGFLSPPQLPLAPTPSFPQLPVPRAEAPPAHKEEGIFIYQIKSN